MTPHAKAAIAGVVIGLVLLALPIPWWVPVLIILLAIGAPVAAWMMLDPSQRRRIKDMRRRQLGR